MENKYNEHERLKKSAQFNLSLFLYVINCRIWVFRNFSLNLVINSTAVKNFHFSNEIAIKYRPDYFPDDLGIVCIKSLLNICTFK